MAWDEPVTGAGGRINVLWRRSGRHQRKTAVSEKTRRARRCISTRCLNAPSVHKYDTEDYRHVDPQFGGDGALLRLRHNTQQAGNAAWCWTACLTTVAIPMPGLTGTISGSGWCLSLPGFAVARLVYSFSEDDGTALDWLGYASSAEAGLSARNSLVNEIYRGRRQYRTPLAESAVEHGRLAAGRGAYAGRRRAGRAITCSTSPGSLEAAKQTQPEAFVCWRTFWRCATMAAGGCGRCGDELSRLHLPDLGIPRQYRYLLRSAARLTPRPAWRGWIITAPGCRISSS